MENKIKVRYFASLRETAGKSEELLSCHADTAESLYQQLRRKYTFDTCGTEVKVAINGSFAAMQTTLKAGDEVVFIPPVAGG